MSGTGLRSIEIGRFATKWGLLASGVGVAVGAASALFLWALTWATKTQTLFPTLLIFLPIFGFLNFKLYSIYGKSVAGGNNLLLDRIHNPHSGIPFRMAPLILISTVLTHLFGGSAGREGTALQMGGSIADLAMRPLRLPKEDRSLLIMAGIAAGFGSVFGTPWAGAVFGVEVLIVGRLRFEAIWPCAIASLVGDQFSRVLGTTHHDYHLMTYVPLTTSFLGLCVVAGVAFAGAGAGFAALTHTIQKFHSTSWFKPIVGGLVIILGTLVVGNRDYNGLSLPLLERTFTGAEILGYAFLLKILFTAVTLGTGYKGGEVTPLFVIGATLGYAFGALVHQPTTIFAALGFAAVFAGAAKTPVACAVMGVELFGGQFAVPMAIACLTSHVVSGKTSIYKRPA